MRKRKWKPVSGFEDYYEVSDDGLVMSLNYRNTNKPSLLRPFKRKQSYLSVALRNKTAKNKSYYIHRLVALAFLGSPNTPDLTVNHKNGIKGDNRVENLEWASPKEQVVHADEVLGKNNRGENCGMAKLTKKQVLEVVRRSRGEVQTALAAEFGVSQTTIGQILLGQRWSSVTGIERRSGRPGGSALSDAQVLEIRERRATGEKLKTIASAYGVTVATASRIVSRNVWQSL